MVPVTSNTTTNQEDIMKSTLNLLQRNINAEDVNPSGWFDPRCCIFFLRELPKDETYDPNTQLMQMAKVLKLNAKETEEFRVKLKSDFNDLLEKLPKEFVDEWKRDRGVSEDYIYDPSKEFTFTIPAFQHSGRVISETNAHVLVHEYCHYLQFLRTVASPMLIWANLNLVRKAELMIQFTKKIGQTQIRFPIKDDNNIHRTLKTLLDDPAVWEILKWHYSRLNYLNANDIREAEAQFNSLMLGKQSLRFRYFRISDHPITIHVREENKVRPQYARAYLETESAFGDFAPSVFPLITYFALSMPFKKYSRFNIEAFEPVHPEEAFQGATDLLKKDLSSGHTYAKYAQQLYRYRRDLRPSRILKRFCQKVCKNNGWIYPSSRNIRKKWIDRLPPSSLFTSQLHMVFDKALMLEKKYGEEIFSDPFTENHKPLLRAIPFPPLILPDEKKLNFLADDFWSRDFVQIVPTMLIMMGFALSIFVSTNVNNECPHETCRFQDLNLCHGVLTYPDSADNCGFPDLIEDLWGLTFSKFSKRN
jgi:hypothetical protein